MTAVTENDLKRLEDLIINGQKAIENSLTEIKTDIKSLEVGQAEIKEDLKALEVGQVEIKGEIKTIDAKINGISDRIVLLETATGKTADLAEKVGELKNWKQIGSIVITAFISSILSGIIGGVIGWLLRSAKFNP